MEDATYRKKKRQRVKVKMRLTDKKLPFYKKWSVSKFIVIILIGCLALFLIVAQIISRLDEKPVDKRYIPKAEVIE